MSLLIKSLRINQGLKRCSILFCPTNHLRLNCAHHFSCLINSSNFQSRLGSLTDYTDHKIFPVPKRKVMTEYLREYVKNKVVNAYESIRYFARTKEKLLGLRLYATLDEVNHSDFITLLKMPDTFYSWFKITELHTWMLLLNLPYQSRKDRLIRIGVINAMWVDAESRCHVLAPANKEKKKNIRALCERFQVSLFLYDDAYFNSDREFASALWYNFFDKENVDPRHIEVLISYIRYQVQHLNEIMLEPDKLEDEKSKVWTPLTTHYENVFNIL